MAFSANSGPVDLDPIVEIAARTITAIKGHIENNKNSIDELKGMFRILGDKETKELHIQFAKGTPLMFPSVKQQQQADG